MVLLLGLTSIDTLELREELFDLVGLEVREINLDIDVGLGRNRGRVYLNAHGGLQQSQVFLIHLHHRSASWST